METYSQFIRNWSVLSKTADSPQIASYEGEKFVFVSGYPMKYQNYLSLSMKAIFGKTIHMTSGQWTFFNEETKEILQGLNLPVDEEHQAETVVNALRGYFGINENDFNAGKVTAKVQHMDELASAINFLSSRHQPQ